MKPLDEVKLLEMRLHRLTDKDRDNYGICQKIRRRIRMLEKEAQTSQGEG